MPTPPSYFVLSADRFDGETPFSTAVPEGWAPDQNPATPRHSATTTIVGRLSFRDLFRPGTQGAVIMVRRWGPAGEGTDAASMRTLTSAENDQIKPPDDPAPKDLDALLESRTLLNTWSPAMFFGPTDALALDWLPDEGGTIEICTAPVMDETMIEQIKASLEAAVSGAFTTQIVTANTTLTAFRGTLYVLAQTPGGATVSLAALADAEIGDRVVYLQAEGNSLLVGTAGDQINYQDEFVVPTGTAVILERTPFGYIATGTAESGVATTITNAVGGGDNVIAPWTGRNVILVNYTARGTITLPDSADVGPDAELVLVRTGAGEGLAAVSGPGPINNSATPIYVPLAGALRILRRIDGPWVAVEMKATPVETLRSGDRTYSSGWSGRRILRLTDAAAQTVTLPVLAGPPTVPIDCELVVVAAGGAAATVTSGDSIRGGGAVGAKSVAVATVGTFRNTGSEWASQVV